MLFFLYEINILKIIFYIILNEPVKSRYLDIKGYLLIGTIPIGN